MTASDAEGSPADKMQNQEPSVGIRGQFFWNVLPLITVTVLGLLSVPLFIRFLGAEMYALWFYVSTFTGIFGFADLGLGVAVGRYIGVALGRNDLKAVREYWGTGNAFVTPLLIAMTVIYIAVGLVLGPRWFNVTAENYSLLGWCFVLGGAGLFFNYYGQMWNILSQAHLDYRFLGILRTGISVLQVVPALFLAYSSGNPAVLLAWSLFVSVIQLALFVWHSRSRYGLGFGFSSARLQRMREMATFTGKTFANLFLSGLFGSIDRVLLGRFASPAGFSHYIVAANVGGRIQSMSGALMGPVFCNTSRVVGQSSRPAAVLNEAFSFVFEWCAHAVLWTIVWHPTLLNLWLGRDLAPSVAPVFVPVIAAACLNAISNVSAAQLGPLNRMGAQIGFQLLTGVLAVVGVWLGWVWGGLSGAAYGYLCSRVGVVLQDIFVIRMVGAKGWFSASVWRLLALYGVVALSFYFASLATAHGSVWAVILAGAHATVLPAHLLLKSKALKRKDECLSPTGVSARDV
ncbi:MAG TPA: oligosaccharide flippase family protein [Phycisphaerae bacterium]|nr:oligosaccharide flippase family protein [Phycisphaerae bacterium]